jgi:hypothetical protein
MLFRVLVGSAVVSLGCHRPAAFPGDASHGAPAGIDAKATTTSCTRVLEGERDTWDVVSDPEILTLLVPGYDWRTGTAPVTAWVDKDGDGIRAGLSAGPGVRDCADRIHPAVRPADEVPSSRTPLAVSTRTVLSRDTLAVWVITGYDGGFCAPRLGFVAVLTRPELSSEIVARTTPLRLECVEAPKHFERVELGATALLLVEDASGTEHGGRQLFHALSMNPGVLEEVGRFDGSGQEGQPWEGSVRKIIATHAVRGEDLVVAETWTHEGCKTDAKSSENICALTSRGASETRFRLEGARLVARHRDGGGE